MKYIFLFLLFPLLAYNQNQKPASPSGRGASPIPAQNSKLKTQYSKLHLRRRHRHIRLPGQGHFRFADKDAEAFENFLRTSAGGSLDVDHLKAMTNKEATMGQLEKDEDLVPLLELPKWEELIKKNFLEKLKD